MRNLISGWQTSNTCLTYVKDKLNHEFVLKGDVNIALFSANVKHFSIFAVILFSQRSHLVIIFTPQQYCAFQTNV